MLGVAVAVWATRDAGKPQPEVTRAVRTATGAIDTMLALLYQAGAQLVAECREHGDAAAAWVDALLAERRDGAR